MVSTGSRLCVFTHDMYRIGSPSEHTLLISPEGMIQVVESIGIFKNARCVYFIQLI